MKKVLARFEASVKYESRLLLSVAGLGLLLSSAACSDDAAQPAAPSAVGLAASSSATASAGVVTYASGLDDDKCLTASGTSAGAAVTISTCTGKSNQAFRWNRRELRLGALCVDAYRATGQDGDAIVLWPCHGRDNQQWRLTSANELKGINGKCIDVPSRNTTDGTGLILWSCHGASNQKWSPTHPADAPSPSPAPGYSARSPHWSHIRTMVTDYRVGYLSSTSQREAEYAWTVGHYDWIISGSTAEYKKRNPRIKHLPAGQYLTVMQSGEHWSDMRAWYARNPQYKIETAFLHRAKPISASNRMTTTIWGSKRWIMNVGDPGYREYTAQRFRRMITRNAGYEADGIFVDEHESNLIGRARGSVEYPVYAEFQAKLVETLRFLRPRLGTDKVIMLNTAEYINQFMLDCIAAAGATHLENLNTPFKEMKDRWDFIDRVVQIGGTAQLVNTQTRDDYNARANFDAGNSASRAARGKLFELGSYYMVVPSPADRVLFTNNNAQWSSRSFESQWSKAVEFNVGAPLAPRSVGASGMDPVGRRYEVWQRDFERALVLVRPMANWNHQTYDGSTRVTIPLPSDETWYPLREDGTLGSAVTSIQLRNAEAAILVKGSAR